MVIETDRLLLRPLERSDAGELVAMHADPEVGRFFVRGVDQARARQLIEIDRQEWRDRGHGLLAVIDRASGAWLGRVALKYWENFDEVEVGWALRREVWGRGYATEAAYACASWGFRDFDMPYLTAMIRPGNLRSVAVARRLSMTPLRADLFSEVAVVVYAITRARWAERLAATNGSLYTR